MLIKPTSPSHAFGVGPSLSALKGGEGIGAASGLQLVPDEFEHTGQIIKDVTVPKADDPIPALGNRAGAGRIFLFL